MVSSQFVEVWVSSEPTWHVWHYRFYTLETYKFIIPLFLSKRLWKMTGDACTVRRQIKHQVKQKEHPTTTYHRSYLANPSEFGFTVTVEPTSAPLDQAAASLAPSLHQLHISALSPIFTASIRHRQVPRWGHRDASPPLPLFRADQHLTSAGKNVNHLAKT